MPGDPAEPPRVAYTIGRRAGNAAARNRVRRRLRMLMRENHELLEPGAYLVGAGAPAVSAGFAELRSSLQKALRSLKDNNRS